VKTSFGETLIEDHVTNGLGNEDHALILHGYRDNATSKISGSQVLPFAVTWRHQSRDLWMRLLRILYPRIKPEVDPMLVAEIISIWRCL